MRRLGWLIPLILLAALVGGAVWLLVRQDKPPTPQVATIKPERRTIVHKAIATGKIVPRKEVQIKPQVRGIIEKLYVRPGEQVRAGQELAKLKVIVDPVSVNQAESQLKVLELERQEASEKLRAAEELGESNDISRENLRERRLAHQIACERANEAKSNLELLRTGVAEGAEVTATIITATTDGTVLERHVNEGAFVVDNSGFHEGTTVFTLADMSNLIFKGLVDEAEAGRLKPGMKMDVTVAALEGQRFPAALEFVAPKAKDENGVVRFEIEAALELTQGDVLRAGYSAIAEILFDRRDQALAIPEQVLGFDDKGAAYIEVESAPGVLERRDIELGLSDGLYIEVIAGLSEEDHVKLR